MRLPTRSWYVLLLALLLCLFLPATARAQESAPAEGAAAPEKPAPEKPAAAPAADVEQKKEEAKRRFQRGLELVQNENWDAALAEFLVSRELYPTRVALKNAAICLRQLKRYVESLAMYNEILERFRGSIPPDELKTVNEAIEKLKSSVGEIQIESDQSGATVVVDGQQREGTTPLPPLGVNAGTHTVRVSKEGFEAYQEQVLVAGGQRKTVAARLKPLSKVGRLVIKEASGKTLDIVIDGAVVGQTPVYQATVAVGPHSVFLRGKDKLGTPPSAASVKENQTSTLTLSAVELDSEIRIEPTPTNATVFVDSVQIGSGIWEGRLQSGTHKIEIAAEGFTPYRGDATLTKGKKELVKVSLERDLSNPMWQAGFVPHIYAEAFAGLALAPGFGGGADSGCSGSKCKSKSLPLGFMGGVRGGYELLRGLGVEVGFGYLYMAEKMTRTIDAIGDRNVIFTSSNYKDQTTIAGLLLMASASYRLLDKTPLTFRVSAGVARLRAVFKNGGTFSGDVRNPCDPMINPTTCDPNETTTVTQTFSIAEEPANIWVPFVAPEARFGIRLAKKISVDFGVALFVMLAPSAVRTGKPTGDAFTNINKSEGQRAFQLNDVPGAFQNPPSDARPGIVNLPKEDGFGTFFGIMPTLGGRFDF